MTPPNARGSTPGVACRTAHTASTYVWCAQNAGSAAARSSRYMLAWIRRSPIATCGSAWAASRPRANDANGSDALRVMARIARLVRK